MYLHKPLNCYNLIKISRLKGGISEDPAYPKGMYPSSKQCEECYTKNGEFDEEKVVEFLVKVYSKPERTLQPVDHIPEHLQKLSLARSDFGKTNSTGGFFSGSDYWIFCIVYFSVATLLVLVYLHFRGYRRIDSSAFCRRFLQNNQAGKSNI